MSDLVVREFSGLRVDYSGAQDDEHLVRLWLQRYAPPPGTTEDGKSATQKAYERDWKLFRRALDAAGVGSLQRVTVSHVYSALDTLGKTCSLETFRRRVFAIKSLFGFAHRTGYLHFNVTSVVRPPPRLETLAERILPAELVFQMIAAAPAGPKRTLLRFLYVSGTRISEAVGIQGKHVLERASGRVQITVHGKGNKTRHVLLTPSISSDLRKLVGQPEDFLFRDLCPRKQGSASRAVRVRAAQRVVTAAAKSAGIEQNVSPHWMRHAHVSHALDHGARLHVVQSTVGHASPSTTARYIHVRPEESSADFIEQ